jgi:hypothetical protein
MSIILTISIILLLYFLCNFLILCGVLNIKKDVSLETAVLCLVFGIPLAIIFVIVGTIVKLNDLFNTKRISKNKITENLGKPVYKLAKLLGFHNLNN